ncbi:MAG TPA: YihY/virulence factor BrkB family protein [Anaeromyxobacter sp.]|nr:YihY/virulence factor BrkB family protein [Anaeromyxobacter sp.]
MTAARPGLAQRLRAFFGARLWEPRLADLSRGRAALYAAARVGDTLVRGFLDTRLSFRAAALTYFTVLSIVPFLAFAFSVLKGFGVYRSFVVGTIRPYVDETFAGNQALYDAIDHILRFVDETDVSKLGSLGVVVLAYAAVTLVANVEVALNAIFGAKARRPLVRQVTDYVTLLVISPLLLLAATTLSATAQSSRAVVLLRERLGLGPVIDFGLGLGPVAFVAVALFAMYVILPNVRVRASSALLGAAIAALLWHASLVVHVQLQMGVARYSALYSVLGAIPIFLVWTYVSWLVVLVGARIAAGRQDPADPRRRLQAAQADPALREQLALALAAEVTRDFVGPGRRASVDELARRLEVAPSLAEEVLDALVRAGVLARVVSGAAAAFLPARDVDALRAEDVREALRRDPAAEPYRARVERRLDPRLRRLLREHEARQRRSPENLTLRELAAACGGDGEAAERAGAAETAEGAGGDDDGRPVLDEKQPDLPP